ncbi:MAG TPA: helix-turn-helix transcriptional regulator, partial [Ramlibacter sp.]
RSLAASLDLWLVQILSVDARNGQLLFSASGGPGSTPEAVLDYVRYYNTIDPRKELALAIEPDGWVESSRQHDALFQANHPFYRDFLVPHGGGHLLGARVLATERAHFMLALVSHHGARPLREAQMNAMERLRHHVCEALRNFVHTRETLAELEMGRALLEPFQYPMLLINENRGIWHVNEAANRLLQSGDVLSSQNGILYARNRGNDSALENAIHGLHRSGPGTRRIVVQLARADGSPCIAFLSAVRPQETMGMFGTISRILVIVHDPAAPGARPDPFILAECFDLTPAEARVAVQLAGGDTAKEIAQRLHLSLATVRTHVSRLLEKFGVCRQTDLVRMVLELPVRGR